MHVPQSNAAVAEAQEQLAVARNMVTPQSNKPIIGLIQDSIMALWKLTAPDRLLDWYTACQLLMAVHSERARDVARIARKRVYSQVPGRLVASALFQISTSQRLLVIHMRMAMLLCEYVMVSL